MNTEIIYKYFNNLSETQKEQFDRLQLLYKEWNDKINVISRKDMDSFYIHHVLHSLAIAKFINFEAGSKIIDIGTGGGFPGIPLAILYPEVQFTLCDSIQKKIKVVTEIATALDLKNVRPIRDRAENINEKYDYVVSRAVTELSNFIGFTKHLPTKGFINLKGGDTDTEILNSITKFKLKKGQFETHQINEWFEEEFFIEKKIVFYKL